MADTADGKLMQKLVSLCKRRGFVFPSSEIYGGLRSGYDYGPRGVELKRNLMNQWWREMVHSRENVVGLDASIIMHPRVWEASGHLSGFADPLVDCHVCKERFRADKAPKASAGEPAPITLADKGRAKVALEMLLAQGEQVQRRGKQIVGALASERGYVCPNCGSPFLSAERQFNLMLRSALGPVDPMGRVAELLEAQETMPRGAELRGLLDRAIKESAVYLRPETAQGMFVQFLNVLQTSGQKLPFGIAQMGKSFRNEVTVEHFIFRSYEFEQMEMEFFCEPGSDDHWMGYWKDRRLDWWQRFANHPEHFRLRPHEPDELAHYAKECYDVEYLYPWGWDELEGVANRTDYDLGKHAKHSGAKLSYFDPQWVCPETGKRGRRVVPYVIEPAAGATRGTLAYLLDAYHEETVQGKKGPETRVVLKLHPALAPIKCAVLPLVKKDGMPEVAREVVKQLFDAGINSKYDEQHAIGKRYRRHDEAGTPFCVTVDGQTLKDNTVTLRDRDTMAQERLPAAEVVQVVAERVR